MGATSRPRVPCRWRASAPGCTVTPTVAPDHHPALLHPRQACSLQSRKVEEMQASKCAWLAIVRFPGSKISFPLAPARPWDTAERSSTSAQ